jgi:hypothetical protein
MRVAALALLAGAACAAPSRAIAPPEAPAAATTAAPAAPAPVTVDALLGRGADEGSVLLRLAIVRAHPLGARVEPFVLAWPGWDATIAAVSPHPVAELDWMAVVGPREPARERLMARTAVDDAVIDARLRDRHDGSLRVVVRGQPHAVVALPPDDAPAVVSALPTARLVEPSGDAEEALHVDFPDPHRMLPQVPKDVRRLVLRAFSRPGGGGEAFADMTCDDEASAGRVANELRERAERANNFMVRMLTLDLLAGLSIATEGRVVKLRLPATREQLEALATLAKGFLPAKRTSGGAVLGPHLALR